MKVRLFTPEIGQEELDEIKSSFDAKWIGLGPKVRKFEKDFFNYLNVSEGDVVATNSATAALHLAILSLSLPKGAKIVVPNITFVSTALVVLHAGYVPVLIDVDENNLQIDLNLLEDLVRGDSSIGAVIAVHLGGHYCDLVKLLKICETFNLRLIEDCANCTGGEFMGKKLGTFGDVGCYSFEEKKNMTTGDGGMIYFRTIEDKPWFEQMRWCGINKDTWRRLKIQEKSDEDPYHWYYEVSLPGYKYNMNDLAASIGIVQLRKLDAMNAYRARLIGLYLKGIESLSQIKPSWEYKLSGTSGYWLFSVVCERRDDLILHLKSKEISTGSHFTPLSLHPLFKKYNISDLNVSLSIHTKLLTLPLHCNMTEDDVNYICQEIKEFYGA